MARPLDDEPLRASLLDRLSGETSVTGRFAGRQSLGQLIESVHRSLEDLLNTRWRATAWPPALDDLERSLVNYGIPDFTGANMSSPADREQFRQMVELAISYHEPRILQVNIEVLDDKEELDRTLRFRIDALVHATPEPAPVAFDSQVDQVTHRIRITAHQQ